MKDRVVLKVSGLTKRYVTRSLFKTETVVAVDRLDFEVKEGEIFGFLGPNGAGKTSTLNMVVGVVEPSAGSLEIFGERFKSGDIAPLARLGYVPEAVSLPDYFSISDLLDFYAQLFCLSRDVRRERIKNLLLLMGLAKEAGTLIKKLSMGQRRLVDIMQALINDPDLILLDEPTVYLDPVIIERLRSVLLRLKTEGKTIIVSSHMLSEIEQISDRVAVICRGKLLKLCTKSEFVAREPMEKAFLRLIKDETGV